MIQQQNRCQVFKLCSILDKNLLSMSNSSIYKWFKIFWIETPDLFKTILLQIITCSCRNFIDEKWASKDSRTEKTLIPKFLSASTSTSKRWTFFSTGAWTNQIDKCLYFSATMKIPSKKCKLIRKLAGTFSSDALADWSCLLSYKTGNSNEYGLFQISKTNNWCTAGKHGGVCNMDCNS